MSHTPGPWRFGFNIVTDRCSIASDTPKTIVARDVAPNDAPLIAAAPELLEAAIAGLDLLEHYGECEHVDKLRAAIAKAEGRS